MFSPFSQSELKIRDHTSPTIAEPMTLGSPVSSPKNKATSQNYLPPYLFGETVTSPVGNTSWNSPKQHSVSFTSPASQINPVSQFRDQQLSYQSQLSSSLINSPNTAKSGGPPIQGLLYSTPRSSFDITKLDNIQSTPDKPVTESHNFSGILTPSKTFSLNNSSYLSPAQIDPFFTQGEALKNGEQLDESWVTIYGFPAASASYILQQFSQYGNIVEHKISPTGNWMHVRYQSKLQAKKALSKNGKVFSGNIMIGVKPCIEMELMNCTKENSLLETSIISVQDVSQSEQLEPTKPNLKNIRPLTQAYLSPKNAAQVAPQKPGGLVSKAFEYLWKTNTAL